MEKVSIIIPTYNWVDGLCEAVKSCTSQTYDNLEIIVVGDECDEATAEMMVDNFHEDERVQYFNLPLRGEGKYPEDPEQKWCVAGVPPINKGLELSTGDWLCVLNDDDLYVPKAIEIMMNAQEKTNGKFLYGLVQFPETIVGNYPPSCGNITADSGMWSAEFKSLRWDVECWKKGRPADWDFFMRLMMKGAKPIMVQHVIAIHSGQMKRLGW